MYLCNIENLNQVKELKRSVLPKDANSEQQQLFYAFVDQWMHDFGRLPNADEFPPIVGVDSLPQVIEKLHLKKLGDKYYTDAKTVQDYTGKTDDAEIARILNTLHKDYTFEVHTVDDEILVSPYKRPTDAVHEIDPLPNMPIEPKAVGHLLHKIEDIHGIKINETTSREVAQLTDFPGAVTLPGFIRNGEIFINIDNSTPYTRVHELMHIFMGGIRFENPELYQSILNLISKDKDIEYKLNQFRHRTMSDRMEEVAVEEISKFLSGNPSSIDNLSTKDKYELDYNIRRLLDTMLDGDFSVKIIEDNVLYKSTLEKIARLVNSSEVFNGMTGTISEAFIHRTLNNQKADLLRRNKLIEIC